MKRTLNQKTVAFDLDGTLAHFDTYRGHGHIGAPIPRGIALLRAVVAAGFEVAVFTARLNPHYYTNEERDAFYQSFGAWRAEYLAGMPVLITCEKSPEFIAFVDDRALYFEQNEGAFDFATLTHLLTKRTKENPGQLESFLRNLFHSSMPHRSVSEISHGAEVTNQARALASKKTVPEILSTMADTYRERNKIYGDSYKHFGNTLHALFPNGLTVNSAEVWGRLAIFLAIIGKAQRYTADFEKGHIDSTHDLPVYGAMLEELTRDLQNVHD